MTIELTEPLQKALDAQEGEPLRVTDPRTNQTYVLLRADLYDRFKVLCEEDDLTAEERLLLLADSGRRAGWDNPVMDDYDHYDAVHRKSFP